MQRVAGSLSSLDMVALAMTLLSVMLRYGELMGSLFPSFSTQM
jgi:hypothetical protein